MKIHQGVYQFFADNDCIRNFESYDEFEGEAQLTGGQRFLNYVENREGGDFSDKGQVYDAKNVNKTLANLVCSQFDGERLVKIGSRIQNFGYIKKDLPTLELGCDNGIFLCCLASLNPQAKFIGVDCREAGIRLARQRAEELGLKNVEFVCDTAEHYLETAGKNRFGLILSLFVWSEVVADFMGNVQDANKLRQTLRMLSGALAQGGKLITFDRLANDQARFAFANLVSQCGLIFSSKECFYIGFGSEFAPFFVFKKGTGSPVQAATLKKMTVV